jgi:hypothetical protein
MIRQSAKCTAVGLDMIAEHARGWFAYFPTVKGTQAIVRSQTSAKAPAVLVMSMNSHERCPALWALGQRWVVQA